MANEPKVNYPPKKNYKGKNMKTLSIAFGAMLSLCASAQQGFYFDVGAGYVVDQSNVSVYSVENSSNGYYLKDTGSDYYSSGAPSAFLSLGYQWQNVRVEIAHNSNWLEGWPVNDEKEHHRTEVRAVYRFWLF